MRAKFLILTAICTLAMAAQLLPANAGVKWSGPGYYLLDLSNIGKGTDDYVAGPFASKADCESAYDSYAATLSPHDRNSDVHTCGYHDKSPANEGDDLPF